MMNSMARFIAPVVLGIVASLQQVIISVVAPLSGGSSGGSVGSEAGSAAVTGAQSTLGGVSVSLADMASPFEFQLIVAFYVVILVIILSYFSGKIQYGDNKTAVMLNIGKTLPVAVIVFVASLYMGGGLVGGIS